MYKITSRLVKIQDDVVSNDASAKQIIYMKYLSLIKRHNYETTCNDPPVFTWEHEKLVKFAL